MNRMVKRLMVVLMSVFMVLGTVTTPVQAKNGSSNTNGWGSRWSWWWPVQPTDPEPDPEPEPTEEPVVEEEEPVVTEEPIVEEEQVVTEEPVIEEETVAIAYPEKDFEPVEINGTTVNVFAPEGALPEGTTLEVTEVSLEDVQAAVDAAADISGTVLAAVDITFYDVNGVKIEPVEGSLVKVNITAPEIAETENVEIVHIPDEAEPETVEQVDVDETAEDEVAFESDQFSIYAIVESGDTATGEARATYEFQNADGSPYEFLNAAGDTVTAQIIKDGEILENVGIPVIGGDETFNGWYIWNESTGTFGDKIEFDTPMSVTETKTIIVRANVGDVGYFTFYEDSEGTVILTKKQIPVNTTYDISQQTLPSPAAGLVFVGWSETPGVDNDDREAIENTTITVTGDHYYYPVYKRAHWLTFVTSQTGAGAKYVPSQYVLYGETTAQPEDPTWKGYKFAYWSTTPHVYAGEGEDTVITNDGSAGRFTFGDTIDQDTTLYAYWENADTDFTIVYWKQKVTDDKDATNKEYSYFTMEKATGKAHEVSNIPASATNKATTDPDHFKGFVYNSDESDTSITVNANGGSVMNVYYDRIKVTMQFYANGTSNPGYNSNVWTNGSQYVTTFTGLYGQTLAQNGYKWPTDGHYSYYNNGGSQTGMTYLGQFVLPDDTRNNSISLIRLYRDTNGTNYTVSYYLENTNNGYDAAPTATGGGNGNFNFSEKYDGFYVYQYRRMYQNGTAAESWQDTYDGDSVTMWYGSQYRPSYYNLQIRYARRTFKLHYLDSVDNSAVLTEQSVKYGYSLAPYKPAASATPSSSHAGKEFDGRWYIDRACSTIAIFGNDAAAELTGYTSIDLTAKTVTFGEDTYKFEYLGTMPNGDLNVYAGWKDIWYWIKVDPNGGVINAQTGGATWFWETYGELVEEYGFIQRDYVESDNGTFYYHYDEFNHEDPNGTQPDTRYGYYTEDASLSTDGGIKYEYQDDAYKLIGWYNVDPETDEPTTPYNFSAEVTDNVYIRAIWRRIGEYRLVYDAVDGSNPPIDSSSYADASDTAILGNPTPPAGYTFTGWEYNGVIYKAGDVIQVDADLADENHEIKITAVYTKYEDIPVGVTHINWYGNMYDVAGLEIPGITSATQYAEIYDDVPYNEARPIEAVADVIDGEAAYSNYTFLGWAKKDVTDTSEPIFTEDDLFLKYIPETDTFQAKDANKNWVDVTSIGADENQPYQDLYAVWQASFYVYHSGVDGGNVETVVMNKTTMPNGTYDLTQNITEDRLYGGYYLDYAGKGSYAGDGKDGDGIAYDGMNYTWSGAQTVNGTRMVPKAGTTYYVKEVPTYYLLPYYQYTYTKADKVIRDIYMLSAIDDCLYSETGTVIFTDRKADVYTSYYIATTSGGKKVTFTATSMFKRQGVTSGGYVSVWKGSELLGEEGFIMRPYWITIDGVKVLGSTARHVSMGNGKVGSGGISKTDEVVGPTIVK